MLTQNDSVNDKSMPPPPSSAATAAVSSQDGSPLTEMPTFSKLSDVGSQQFKSPRLQQLLGNRAAGPQGPSASDSTVPAVSEDGTPCLTAAGADSLVPADSEAGHATETVDIVDVAAVGYVDNTHT